MSDWTVARRRWGHPDGDSLGAGKPMPHSVTNVFQLGKALGQLVLAAIFASVATAQSGAVFELRVESPPNAPNAKAWILRGQSDRGETVLLGSTVLLDAAAIASADVEQSPDGSTQIRLVLTSNGAQKLREITMRYAGRRLGIVADGQLWAAPFITGVVDNGILVVSVRIARAEAEALARKLGPPATSAANGRPAGISRPSAGAPRAGAGGANAIAELQGSWSVINATMNGRLAGDSNLTSSTWTFQDDELTLRAGSGEPARFALAMEGGSPRAFRLEPIAPSKQGGGWMIFARDGERLTLAFGENLQGRPETFDPAPKKVVLKLARSGRASAAPTPCDALRTGGIATLLPGGVRQADRERGVPGPACAFSDSMGQEVVLMVVPAAGLRAFEAEVEGVRRQPRYKVQNEPELGPAAVSVVRGYEVRFLVLKRDTVVWLSFQLARTDVRRLKEFAKRVLAQI